MTARRNQSNKNANSNPAPPRVSMAHFVPGVAVLIVAAASALALVVEHFFGVSLPGCGEGGACEQAANSVWGAIRVGGFEWPVSYLGLAYFAAILTTWLATRGALPPIFRNLVRFGMLLSAGFVVIMFAKWLFCPYCIATHLANFAYWIIVEFAARSAAQTEPRASASGTKSAFTFIGAFAAITLTLGVWNARHLAAIEAAAEKDRDAATQQIIARSTDGARPDAQTKTPTPPAAATNTTTGAPPPGPPFAGRHRIGPENAPIRIVMFTDYQCRDCYKMEQQLTKLYETRDDISISIKHFPFNKDCNPSVGRTLHANACWAARAAEAAGILWGPDGFWAMHQWLFARRGSFENTAQLEAGIRELGYDPAGFTQVMTSNETLQNIQQDCAEGKRLGLFFTPMIFINGVELKGWSAPNALIRTVEQVAATNPPPRSAAYDHPPLAFQKYVDDWREQPVLDLPPDEHPVSFGPADAPTTVVLWGDYQEPGTAKADGIIRAFVAAHDNIRYTYRHYPFNRECNPHIQSIRFEHACRAAAAAEAAGQLAGPDAHAAMHVWLMEIGDQFSDETLRAAATEQGLDPDALFTAMDTPEVQDAIHADTDAAAALPSLRYGLPAGLHGIPGIFVNNRFVPRWKLDDQPVLEAILTAAAGE